MPRDSHEARPEWPLNHDWWFVRRKMRASRLADHDPAGAERVDLPHCWNRTDSFQPGLTYYRGPGTYWRSLRVPEALASRDDSHLVLVTEGFYGTGDLWLDGQERSRFDAEYLGVEVRLPAEVKDGEEHRLALRLTNRCSRNTLPGHPMPDFLLYGGLAGRVHLLSRRNLHLRDDALILLISPEGPAEFRVSLGWEVCNRSDARRRFRVRWVVQDANGRVLGETFSEVDTIALPTLSQAGQSSLRVEGVQRWEPEDPVLYWLRGDVLENGQCVDSVARRIGFREAAFRGADGFQLNGRRLLLRGCNRHESLPGYGNAFPLEQHREDARWLREMGFNFVRLSHYPQHPAFLDACDELGILVFPELASWKSVRGGGWLRNAHRQLRRMIQRDRHHPSVILWGLGNEARHRRAFRALDALARDLDPERATLYAENHLYRARRRKTLGLTDVWGVNYELEVIPEVHACCQTGSVLVTECSNEPHTERGDLEAEARQTQRVLADLQRMLADPHVAGYALWCFNDYATLRKDRYRRFSGVFDAWRVPKMAAFAHRALSDCSPVLHLLADWRRDAPHGPGCVHVISNCDRIEWTCGHGHGELGLNSIHTPLEVATAGDRLQVTGWKGEATVQAECRPYGAAHSLRLESADGRLTLTRGHGLALRVWVADERGECVVGWNGMVAARADGPVDLRPPTASGEIWMHGGEGRLLLCGGRATGGALVWVEQADLGEARIEVKVD